MKKYGGIEEMSLNTFKDLIQLLVVFAFGYGLCHYLNVVKTYNDLDKSLPQVCVPLYNYCAAVQAENRVIKRNCQDE